VSNHDQEVNVLQGSRLTAQLFLFLSLIVGNRLSERAFVAQATTDRSGPPPIHSQGTSFKNVAGGEMLGENGVKVPFSDYKTPDGTGLMATDPGFASPEKAVEYFELRLSKAQKVSHRGKKRNLHGRIIGQRAEAIYLSVDGTTYNAILWTDGRVFREIDSSSLPLSLKLEKAFTP
jgi:hypothetical protein